MIARTTNFWIAIVGLMLTIELFIPTLPTLANPSNNTTQIKPAVVKLMGTIRKLEVEGTCYQLATSSGKNYELIGKFPKQDGVKVQVQGIVETDMATICQVGQPFKVKSYRIIR
jgi:hypothetical protein